MIKLKVPVFRGARIEEYEGKGQLTLDQLFLSFGAAKIHYNWDPNIILGQEGYNCEFNQLLVDVNFWLSIETKKSYWRRYLVLGHPFGPVLGFPAWIGRMILVEKDEDVDDRIYRLIARVNSMKTTISRSFDYLETLFPVYEEGRIYSDLDRASNPMALSFNVADSEFIQTEEKAKGCILNCSLEFKEKGCNKAEILFFKINVFTPEYVRGVPVDRYILFPPHVIVEKIDVPELVKYVSSSILSLSVGSKLALLFKLSVFTDSFVAEGILEDLPLESDHQFEVEFFDLRK